MRFLVLLFVFILGQEVFADTRPERIVSSAAQVYVQTAPVKKLLESLNHAIDRVFDENTAMAVKLQRDRFLQKTGLDYLDEYSLRKLGVDTSRSISLAKFPDFRNTSMMMFLIPVLDEEKFPLKFIEIIRKNRPSDEDIYPVITPYKNHSIYQIGRDVFCTSVNCNFLIASNGDILRDSIDSLDDPSATLLYDKNYMKYMKELDDAQDVNVFVKGEMFKSLAQGKTVSGNRVKVNAKISSSMSLLNLSEMVEYIHGGMTIGKGDIFFTAGTRYYENSEINSLLNIFKPMKTGMTIQNGDISVMMLSLDMKSIKGLCGNKKSTVCEEFKLFSADLKKNTGLDFNRDLYGNYTGMVEVYSGTNKDKAVSYAAKFPMKSRKGSLAVWKKMRSHFSIKYGKGGGYRAVKAKGMSVFRIGKDGARSYVVLSKSSVIIARDMDFLDKIIKGEGAKTGTPLLKEQFMFLHLKNDLLKYMVSGFGQRSLPAKGFLEKILDITASYRKKGSSMIFESTVSFK